VARDVAISGYYQLCLSGFNARCYTPRLLRRCYALLAMTMAY
ncbi:MAG: hypothetical protein ACI9CF_000777, partial [Candidatus Omnitrophota bacterium]